MKLPYKQIEPFVKSPNPQARVILVYGPEEGLMRERSQTMAKTVVEDLNDPFNAVTLSASQISEDPARLMDEALAQSLMGGQRLIRVTDAADKLTVIIKDYLTEPSADNLIILEAGELGPRSSLRKLVESADNAAAVPCYVEDERALSGFIRQVLQAENLNASPDAVSWLAESLIGDRGRARKEIEKLITYKGDDTSPISLEDAQSCCGMAGAKTLDDLVYAIGGRNTAKALNVYRQLLEEGIPVIAVLRATQNHFRRLHQAHAIMSEGKSADQAMKSLSPPIFFKQSDAFKAQINSWRPAALQRALQRLQELEAQCKQTGYPTETLCGQALLSLSYSPSRRRAA